MSKKVKEVMVSIYHVITLFQAHDFDWAPKTARARVSLTIFVWLSLLAGDHRQ